MKRNRRGGVLLLLLAVMLGLCACGMESAAVRMEMPAIVVLPVNKKLPIDAKLLPRRTEPWADKQNNAISLKGGAELDWVCGVPFAEPGYTALDMDGSDRSDQVQVSGEVVFWRPGDYELHYSFQNAAGETVSASRLVHQLPAELPKEAAAEEKVIYLTFDDGPCENTPAVLELLERYDAKATFFVILNRKECAELLPRIQEQGHSIGIHAFEHEYNRIYRNETAFFNDLLKAQQQMYAITGSYARLLRFPGGSTTAKNMMGNCFPTVKQGLADMGIQYFDWNVQPEDSQGCSETDTLNAFILSVPQWTTPVVLQHDTRSYSMNALESMLKWGTENGYRFQALEPQTPGVRKN